MIAAFGRMSLPVTLFLNEARHMIARNKIVEFLNSYLDPDKTPDSSCNGLQVQGQKKIKKIGLAVDASMLTYEMAVDEKCQMLMVHHGLIWNGIRYVSGTVLRQLKYLMDNGVNLYASHLPLDKHPVVGNNIQLAHMLGLTDTRPDFSYRGVEIGCTGVFRKPLSIREIADRLKSSLGGLPVLLPFGKKKNVTIGIVSGGGAGELPQAIDQGIDCFITGEAEHQNHHQARDNEINVIFAGHYETETVGVKAVGRLLEKKFGVKTVFLDAPTLV